MTLTNRHSTYIDTNFTVLTAMLPKVHVYGMWSHWVSTSQCFEGTTILQYVGN